MNTAGMYVIVCERFTGMTVRAYHVTGIIVILMAFGYVIHVCNGGNPHIWGMRYFPAPCIKQAVLSMVAANGFWLGTPNLLWVWCDYSWHGHGWRKPFYIGQAKYHWQKPLDLVCISWNIATSHVGNISHTWILITSLNQLLQLF